MLLVRFVLLWFWLDVLLFLLLGVLEYSIRNVLSSVILLLVWFAAVTVPKIFGKSNWFEDNPGAAYLFAVFLMALFEETLVTMNGGGLGGKATSLAHDLTMAVPVFIGIGTGLYLAHRILPMSRGEFFLFGALFGFFIETVLNGAWSGLVLLGGGAMGLYGIILSAHTPEIENPAPLGIKKVLIVMSLGTVFMLAGAVAGNTLWRLAGGSPL
ncbi:hypothetical protein [Thermococcus sp. JdF3]|uniref:hypothetical protein n=1 Tax=Thermococcus sp. JdF3 TaxID=1638258 RepID=UPI001F0D3705|nr:hypothetical protein [Thermococcus sp. JdF3]